MNPQKPLEPFIQGLQASKWRQIADDDIFPEVLAACLLSYQRKLKPTDAMTASQNSFRLDGANELTEMLLNLGVMKQTPAARRDESALATLDAGWGPKPLTPPPTT